MARASSGWVEVRIGPPFTVGTGALSFTGYCLSSWPAGADPEGDQKMMVTRRFSEFHQMHMALKDKGKYALPDCPTKKAFGNFDQKFLEDRRRQLEDYLQAVVGLPGMRDEPILRSFLRHKYLSHPSFCSGCGEGIDVTAGQTVKRGYLEKRGKINTQWKRRYFVIGGTHMAYYQAEECVGMDQPIGVIHLVGCTEERDMAHSTPTRHAFIVRTNVSTYVLAGESRDVADEWILALSRARKPLEQDSTRTGKQKPLLAS